MFSVRPATCSVRYGKQTIIVSFDRFTSLSLVFCDRPWQIFFKVNLEVLLWNFSLIRKSYTFHNFICVLLQIWRTTTGSIITPCTFGTTLFCNSIYYDVWFLSCVSFLKVWFATDILWFLGKFARCWFVFTKFINVIMTSILVLSMLLCTINLKFWIFSRWQIVASTINCSDFVIFLSQSQVSQVWVTSSIEHFLKHWLNFSIWWTDWILFW